MDKIGLSESKYYRNKYKFDEKIKRHKDFLSRREVNRPLISFFVGDYFFFNRYPSASKLKGLRDLKPSDINPSEYLSDYQMLAELTNSCPGDAIWTAAPLWGVPWLEAIIGSRIEISEITGTSRAMSTEKTDRIIKTRDIEINKGWLDKYLEFTSFLADHSDGLFPVSSSLLRGPADLLSVIFGETMVYKFYDVPDLISELALKLADLSAYVALKQAELIPEFEGGYGSFFRNIWASKRCGWIQEDAVSLLSPKIYEDFLVNVDERVAEAFDFPFYHLHSSALLSLPYLLRIENVSVIEIFMDLAGPRPVEFIEKFREVLETKCLHIFLETGMEEDVKLLLKELPYSGLSIQIKVGGLGQALKIMEQVMEIIDRSEQGV
ncbi:MAG: hypothetical protein M1371_09140 [Actinobacteria bacterium]|nr:hypothetical protein [Actinomycetota bacterium]